MRRWRDITGKFSLRRFLADLVVAGGLGASIGYAVSFDTNLTTSIIVGVGITTALMMLFKSQRRSD